MKRLSVRSFAVLLGLSLAAAAFVGAPAAQAGGKCKAYKPGADGKGKPVTVVTDKATAKKPATVSVDTPPGLGLSSADGPSGDQGATAHTYVNLQVDPKAASTGLFVRVEFQYPEDYDVFLRDSGGSAWAYAAGFNEAPLPDGGTVGLDGTGHGGHSEMGAEQIDGASVKDCQGFTLDISSATTPGGAVTVKYWFGKPGNN
jgi:hypothetical protein